MTISRNLLDAAGAATANPPDARAAADALAASRRPDGAFTDRAGNSDLYYAAFALMALRALGRDADPDGATAAWLGGFGDGEGLDLVHLCCLPRCWASLPAQPPDRHGLLARVESFRSDDRGFAPKPGAPTATAYACFLAVGAVEDLHGDLGGADAIAEALDALRLPDGAYANDTNLPVGSVPATAAAVVTLADLGRELPDAGAAADWLADQQSPDGGFRSLPMAPGGDLLATAVALHALATMERPLPEAAADAAARFTLACRTEAGAFASTPGDTSGDAEYTFYALLAMGHLARRPA